MKDIEECEQMVIGGTMATALFGLAVWLHWYFVVIYRISFHHCYSLIRVCLT